MGQVVEKAPTETTGRKKKPAEITKPVFEPHPEMTTFYCL